MAIFDGKTQLRIEPGTGRELATQSAQTIEPRPKTQIKSGGTKKSFFNEQKRTPELMKKWWNTYEQGGVYASAIDAYAYSIFANGWRLEGKENFVQEVEDNFKQFDFDTVGMQAVIQSLIFGDSIQEAAPGRGGNGMPVAIMMRDSSTFDWDADEYGIIKNYSQKVSTNGMNEKGKTVKPDQIIHIQLNPSGDKYGISLIQRAWDEIMRDTRTAESSAEAIDRHGFKKYHIKVGQQGELVPQTVIDTVSDEFEDITAKNEFTTSADVAINQLDEGGLEKIEEYNNISLMRVAAALAIPEEAIGIRRGSTDATAVSRMDYWLKTNISAKQRTIARAYTLQYIDRITTPGEVKLVFNDVSENDEATRAGWVGKLLTSLAQANIEVLPQVFEIFPKLWIQKQFGIIASPDQNATTKQTPTQKEPTPKDTIPNATPKETKVPQ